jgi:hypothetical protein
MGIRSRNVGIEMDQGVDFNLMMGIGGCNGPIDITGYEFLGEMRSTTDLAVSELVAEFQFTIQNQASSKGNVLMSLPSEATSENEIPTSTANATVPKRQRTPFLFDVKMKDTLGNISRILRGIVYLSPEATQEKFS